MATVVVMMTISSLVTVAMLLLLAVLFAPQLSNTLWNTDVTQQSLYGTSAAIQNAQAIIDLTSTVHVIQASDQQSILESLGAREILIDAREADLKATEDAIKNSIIATQTAQVLVNEQQRTQAAVNYSETQSAVNLQSTIIAIEATSTQLALNTAPEPTEVIEERPFVLRDDSGAFPYSITDCNWQGMAGTVYDLQGEPIATGTFQIRILGGETEHLVPLGENLGIDDEYHWAIQLADEISDLSYFVRLEDEDGNALSQMIKITFESSCTKNLAIVNFNQIQTLED